MRQWFSDRLFRTVMRNAGYLGSTKLIGAGLGLLAIAGAGHALSPTDFGILMIVHAYANGAGALVKFQSWQVIVRYGAPALQRGNRSVACHAIQFAFALDITSGLFGMLLAMGVLPFLSAHFGVPPAYLWLALGYCTLVPTMSAATPTGVLRLLDSFDLLALQQFVTPLLRAIGAGASWFWNLGFVGFVVTWYLADLLGDLVLWGMAIGVLHRRKMGDALRPKLFGLSRSLAGSWNFAWTTNIATSVDAAWGPVSNLIVATILGPAAAGLYKIASTLLDSAGKPANLLARGFYPEIMRLNPSSKQPWQLGARVGLLSGSIGLIVVLLVLLGGKPLIAIAFSRKYIAAYELIPTMVLALVVSMASFPLEPLLYMVGRQRAALVSQVSGTVLYLGALIILTRDLGLRGAGVAYLLGAICLAALRLAPTVSSYRNRHRYEWERQI